MGHNLPKNAEDEDVYDNVQAVAEITNDCSAILYTHYHGDHIGLFHNVQDDIPQYIGGVAKLIVCRKYEQLAHLPNGAEKYRHALDLDLASKM